MLDINFTELIENLTIFYINKTLVKTQQSEFLEFCKESSESSLFVNIHFVAILMIYLFYKLFSNT